MRLARYFLAAAALGTMGNSVSNPTGLAHRIADDVSSGASLANTLSEDVATAETLDVLSQLNGCESRLREGITTDYILLDFMCEEGAGERSITIAHLSFNENKLRYISVQDSIAFGPTQSARRMSAPLTPYQTLETLKEAVIEGSDVSAGGLFPVNEWQEARLETFGQCNWRLQRFRPLPAPSALVHCEGEGEDEDWEIRIAIDSSGLPEFVKIRSVRLIPGPSYHG